MPVETEMLVNRMLKAPLLAVVLAAVAGGCGKKEEPVAAVPAVGREDVICSYAPSQSSVVSHLSALAGGGAAAAAAIASATGLTAVTHSSGAYILTGSAGYIAGTLGTAIVGPAVVAVGVVAGGASVTVELLCAPRNHPEFAAKVEAAASEFVERSKGLASQAMETTSPVIAKLQGAVVRSGEDAVAYARRKSVEVSAAFKDGVK